MLINSLPYKGKIVQRSLKAFICVEIDSPAYKVASSHFLGACTVPVPYCFGLLVYWEQELGIQVEAEANEVLPSLFYHLKNRFFKENKNSVPLKRGGVILVMKSRYLFLLIFLFSSCKSVEMGLLRMGSEDDVPSKKEKVEKIDFCSLPSYQGKLIRIKAKYSGVEEYWSISSINDCSTEDMELLDNIWLDFEDYVLVFPWNFIKRKRLNKLHNNYWKYDGEIVIEGYFNSESENGYGHLNSYDSEFVVTYLRKIKLVKKKNDTT